MNKNKNLLCFIIWWCVRRCYDSEYFQLLFLWLLLQYLKKLLPLEKVRKWENEEYSTRIQKK